MNRGDIDAILPLFAEDVELHELEEVPDDLIFHGHAGIREWYDHVRELLGAVRFEPQAFWEGDGVTMIEVAAAGEGRTEGVPVEWTVYMVNHMSDGRVVRVHGHLDREAAFAAAGPVVPV